MFADFPLYHVSARTSRIFVSWDASPRGSQAKGYPDKFLDIQNRERTKATLVWKKRVVITRPFKSGHLIELAKTSGVRKSIPNGELNTVQTTKKGNLFGQLTKVRT